MDIQGQGEGHFNLKIGKSIKTHFHYIQFTNMLWINLQLMENYWLHIMESFTIGDPDVLSIPY